MRKVICKNCGKDFYTDMPNTKYCSLECKEQGRIKKRMEWKSNHPNYYKEYKNK